VGDDVRLVEARVLGLHVIDVGLVLEVVVEADLRAPERRSVDLFLALAEVFGAVRGDGLIEEGVVATMPSIRSKAICAMRARGSICSASARSF